MAHINLTVGYGENVIQEHGKHLTKANRDALIASTSALAQFWFVDVFPFCGYNLCCHQTCCLKSIVLVEYLPAWFPGARFQRIAKKNQELARDIRYLGYHAAQDAYVSGNHCPLSCHLHTNRFICAGEWSPR